MSSQKFLIGHLLPQAFRAPTKTPTVGLPPPQPASSSIRFLPSCFSRSERSDEGRPSCTSRPRALRKADMVLYLFLSDGLRILTLNHRSHCPRRPTRKRARENPTMNEAMADWEQLRSTAMS